ncbi:MAG: hypothetical protein AB7I59_28915 [Geminicoccaceae bacterium]
MAFAADFSRGGPTGAPQLEALRRRHAHDGIYGLALVAGCLIGIGLSWQTVLSEGARERLVAGLFGLSEDAGVGPPAVTGPSILAADRTELGAVDAAMRPSPAFKPPPLSSDMREGGDIPAALPERLLLDEEEKPAAAVPGPSATSEIVFAMNSSFLVSGDYLELRRFVSALPEQGPLRVVIAATVSDEPLRNGDLREAARYNQWLAERRADRVAEWLRRQLGTRAALETGLVPHDASRRVTIDARPAP